MFDFDTVYNRYGTHSLKWDAPNEIPLWVADMDFRVAPAILDAFKKTIEHGIFGYNVLPQLFYESIMFWWKEYHHYEIQKEWIVYCNGIVPAISSIIRHCTSYNAKVLLQTPVYHAFFRCVESNGRVVCESPLEYHDGEYHINFTSLEKDLASPDVELMIVCNPHNPIGKIWTDIELQSIASLCEKHNVLLISDEIHCDLTEPHVSYTPMARTTQYPIIVALSASKAFNLAGVGGAFCIIENKDLRDRITKAFNVDELNSPTTFSIEATIAALMYSREWLNELNAYVSENKKLVTQMLHTTALKIVGGEATYMLWIQTSNIASHSEHLCRFLRKQAALYFSHGTQFRGNGDLFLRANLAMPRSLLKEAMQRLKDSIEKYKISC